MGHKVGYARVSTTGQSLDIQVEALENYGCDRIYQEKKSGTTTDGREELKTALDYCRDGDVFIITRLDRMARSVLDLNKMVQELKDKGVGLVVIEQNIDTTTAEGRLLFNMLGAIAEFETDLRKARQMEGIRKAQEAGKYKGRKRTVSDEQVEEIKVRMKTEKISVTNLAKEYGISRAYIYRLVKGDRS